MKFKMINIGISVLLSAVLNLLPIGAALAEPACASDDEAVCKAEKDERVAQYSKGRNAYENARTTGDFGESYAIARKLAATGDKNGERLLKMVHIQLGSGAHKDFVQAYGWLSEGIADGLEYVTVWRKRLTGKMSPEQISEAKKLVGD